MNEAGSNNANAVIGDLKQFLVALVTPGEQHHDIMLRGLASTLTAKMHYRVHTQGLDSNGNPIGTYSKSYMAVRTGRFGNSKSIKSGKNKGKIVSAGNFTKKKVLTTGPDGSTKATFQKIKGGLRPKYHRTDDPKVILSLTRQMENDLGLCQADPIKTELGYGIGYKNSHNYQKLLWCEQTYGKAILTHTTKEEEEMVYELAQEYIDKNIPSAGN